MKKRPVLRDLDEGQWRGDSVLERGGSAARAWACPPGRVLAVLPDLRQAVDFAADRRELVPGPALVLKEPPLTQSIGSRPLLLERGQTLRRWVREGGLLAATPGALMAPCLLGETGLSLRPGEDYPRETLTAWLEANGYQRADLVWSPGQYVIRGFIMDVFVPGHALPLRLEFMDDTLERIGLFQPATQRSVSAALDGAELHSLTKAGPSSPLSLIPPDARVLLCDPRRIEGRALSFHWMWEGLRATADPATGPIPTWEETFAQLRRWPYLRLTDEAEAADAELPLESLPSFKGEFTTVMRLCQELRGFDLSIRTTNPRLLDLEKGPFAGLGLEVREGSLTSGFLDRLARRAFLSDRELSGVTAQRQGEAGRAPLEWKDRLLPGQLVVHEDYGLGAFRGIEEVGGPDAPMDALVIGFANDQRLLVPVLQSGRITALPEHESDETQLDSLRSVRWSHNLEKDRERAREEARILLDIFARRELERRPPWAEGGELYEGFVRAFPYAETADQLKAVEDIMRDLSGPFPMDRLLVGDVGFGKTEVALRAAFRAVMAGFQVCVLVPTTILAQQHYATFQSRLAGFPVSVGLLSRFVPRREMERTLKRAEAGMVDIVIGTHKVLQKGVAFKNLGLLIIDEEHRFGVMHKEGLKRTYGAVDILSLSATPIPRTLAMALRGMRSISILSTPPEDRLPVTTFAGPWDPEIVRRAVAYELNRGGQVYFLANRISRMEGQRRALADLFPEARVSLAHGQMPERELESTMMDFYSGKVDVLVATTIIESGLDVGRANTILVDDAQELGLAQMYQLRGRVGRRGENAFAYFFYPDKATLRRETADRLDAISTMTELGSGYALARRDLEIRGGGEIGGTRQHGSGRAAGFQIFYHMLERELNILRGEEERRVDLSFDQSGSIPAAYVPQEAVRVTLYRRLLQIVGLDELDALEEEMGDRFGPLPASTRLLFALTAIRNFGGRYGLEKVEVRGGKTLIVGDLTELGPRMRAGGWTALGTHAEGPGGLEGARALVSFLRACPVKTGHEGADDSGEAGA